MFQNYLKSENKDIQLLMDYAKRLDNGAVFKRLGFLLELYAHDQQAAMNECKAQMTKGNTNLDPSLRADRLITRWRLWVPESWANPERSLSSSDGTKEN